MTFCVYCLRCSSCTNLKISDRGVCVVICSCCSLFLLLSLIFCFFYFAINFTHVFYYIIVCAFYVILLLGSYCSNIGCNNSHNKGVWFHLG